MFVIWWRKFSPTFVRFPLLSSKQADVERFDKSVQLVYEGKHLGPVDWPKSSVWRWK